MRTWVLALATTIAASPVSAQTYEGARLLSLSGAERALGTGNDSIFVNPAGMALANAYSVELGALDDLSNGDRRFNLSIADSHDKPVAGGISYTYRDFELAGSTNDHRSSVHRFDLALATRITEHAALGVGARYVTTSERIGDEDVEDGGFNQFTLDAGLQWQSPQGFALGLAAYNLTNPDRKETPISWGAGVGYRFSIVSFEADINYNAKIGKPRFEGGVSLVIAEIIPLRVGLSYDRATESTGISGGIGYQSGRFGIDLGYRNKLSGEVAPGLAGERMLGIAIRAVPFL
jgi:hypothetical protein